MLRIVVSCVCVCVCVCVCGVFAHFPTKNVIGLGFPWGRFHFNHLTNLFRLFACFSKNHQSSKPQT